MRSHKKDTINLKRNTKMAVQKKKLQSDEEI